MFLSVSIFCPSCSHHHADANRDAQFRWARPTRTKETPTPALSACRSLFGVRCCRSGSSIRTPPASLRTPSCGGRCRRLLPPHHLLPPRPYFPGADFAHENPSTQRTRTAQSGRRFRQKSQLLTRGSGLDSDCRRLCICLHRSRCCWSLRRCRLVNCDPIHLCMHHLWPQHLMPTLPPSITRHQTISDRI